MRTASLYRFLTVLLAGVSLVVAGRACADTFVGQKFAVATVNPIATEAGVEVLREGGNAVDAAISAALTLAVVDGHNSGIGGGCLILIRTADGRLTAIDGRERAPAKATPDMFVIDGKLDPMASQTGPLASGVPGALAAYDKAAKLCGSKPLSRLIEPARHAAAGGFVIDSRLGAVIAGTKEKLRKFPGTRAVYFKPDGTVYREGDRLVQKDLAGTLANVQEHGIDGFYRGKTAEQIGEWMQANGGIMTADDFANYEAVERTPLRTTYRGYTIIGFPPPSSGGVHVAEALNMLEGYDLAAINKRSSVDATHLIAEVMTRVFADRAYWLGDADYVDVPRGLIEKAYAKQLATTIDLDRATPVPTHGTPPEWRQDLFGRHTTHIAAADAAGNWVAITATINTSFGSGVIVPGTGVVMNNEMDDFSIQPGVPNAFGLVGAENNAIAPGKRPLSSMSPTIVLDEQDQPLMTIGAAGGPKIITQVLLGVIRYLDFGQSLADALATPRFHHQWRPNELGLESTASDEWREELASRGHRVTTLPSAGVSQAIAKTKDGRLMAVSDPRVPGKADGE
ncbi:gamma-glutamyltransferase [Aeoliella sp. SH292]|uniref:gamma-glutamyltransferase n=1 Tax=Aeoliella sp. SH292 TaxID=3454464 RepID=UPI003F997AFF